MTALLVLAHGSPTPTANAPLLTLVEELRARERFDRVEAAFLECNEPSIPEALDAAVAAGATQIVAVPYFLHTGTHVAQDLPALLRDAQQRHPDVTFRIGPYLGLSPALTDLLAARAGLP